MQLNLKVHNVTSLEFKTGLTLSDDSISKIRSVASPDEDGDSFFVDTYKGHRAFVLVREIDEDARRFEIEFTYQPLSGGRVLKRIPRIEQLIEILSSIQEPIAFNCEVAFVFGKRLRPRCIISLPMKYIEAPNVPFDRIQGLHLVKLDAQPKYEIFLEAPARGILGANILFEYTSKVDESLASKILVEAEAISNKFVIKEQKNVRKA